MGGRQGLRATAWAESVVGEVSRTLAMCNPEAALLRQEEIFSTTLTQNIINPILKPLLLADPEPSDPCGKECLRLLQQLHKNAEQLLDVTEQSLLSLRQRSCCQPSKGLEAILLLSNTNHVLQAHMEYIKSYTDCVVVQAFQKVSKKRRSHRKALWQLSPGISEGSEGTTLCKALHQPLVHHVQKYVFLLLSLRDTLDEKHPAQELMMRAVTLFGNLESFMKQALDQAVATQALWPSLNSRLRDVLCAPTHRLLQDSQDIPVVVTPLQAERVLLFDDALVLLQDHNVHTFDLKLVWVEPGQDKCVLHILTPEEKFSFVSSDPKGQVAWQQKVTQAVCQALCDKKDLPVLGSGQEPSMPPEYRSVAYTFHREGRLYQATYEGDWYQAKPHGKGTLKWPDGRNHVGDFCQGLEHGFGICLVPQASEDKFDCYKCHWWEGRMCEYGICEYGTDKVYKGYFQAGLRHGFGILDSAPQAPQTFRYTGHWERGQRNGYGIEEDRDRGERYIGMWQADQRHGPGVVVTQAGVCYQGTFQGDKMAGPGILLCEDDSLYEGTFTRELTLLGKGKVTFPNGFTLDGSFSSGTNKGLYTQGVLDMAALPPDPSSTRKRQLGLGAFPVESRWQGVYSPFRDFVRLGCPVELQEALLGFHVQSSRELHKSQEYLCGESMEDILTELPQHREPEALQQYLRKALSNSRHPLGKLLHTLMLTFQATYSGVGANKHLQEMAQEEVKQHARELWAVYRGLLKVALQRQGQTLEEENMETRDLQVHGLLLPLILPSFYSELFTLYLLLHEREDGLYSRGITNLSLFPDTKLLEFLDVQEHLWPLKDLKLTSNQRYSLVRDKCFLSATECLQKIITTVHPREKLETLEKTYREIEATVKRVLGCEYKLPMDDLLPLLVYVVSRAQIQHLGAEIHLIRDMMDPIHTGGLHDFLLTALESCYEHIQKEDMRLHRLPGQWGTRELW
ncbi:ALS2 C-terminal-like protein isoform X2 [Arvicanthis niloticus]|uniref:ALS2 C-terminal-like protein isoform X2 n=1 Tax=Arvicanthis niloticus TaxID=61156 RepID=UPI001487345E|nr:ALS2 C-terminal-like protein isoform X2 [Arvicanthis niloticus]